MRFAMLLQGLWGFLKKQETGFEVLVVVKLKDFLTSCNCGVKHQEGVDLEENIV